MSEGGDEGKGRIVEMEMRILISPDESIKNAKGCRDGAVLKTTEIWCI